MRQRILNLVYKWGMVLLIGLIVVAAFAAPMAVIRDSHAETERIIMEIANDSERDLERAIRVNVLTIVCLAALPDDERNVDGLVECINDQLPRDEEIDPR